MSTQEQLDKILALLESQASGRKPKQSAPTTLKRFKRRNPDPSPQCRELGRALQENCRWTKGTGGAARDEYCAAVGNMLRRCDYTSGAPHLNGPLPEWYERDNTGFATRDPVTGYSIYDPNAPRAYDDTNWDSNDIFMLDDLQDAITGEPISRRRQTQQQIPMQQQSMQFAQPMQQS
jgi:hypothetical protein